MGLPIMYNSEVSKRVLRLNEKVSFIEGGAWLPLPKLVLAVVKDGGSDEK